MKRSILGRISVVLAAAIFATSCKVDINGITGSGNVVRETRNVGQDFTGIHADAGLEVEVSQSESASVIVEADDNLQKHIYTKVENGVLKITSDFNSYTNVKSKKVIVTMPVIRNLETSGGSSLSSQNVLKSDDLVVKSESGSEITLSVEADKLVCETASGSETNISGKALVFETSSSSGSSLNARALMANEIRSQASSGSSTDIHPLVSLDAKASSGSSIDYTGSPKNISKEENSGGSVSGN